MKKTLFHIVLALTIGLAACSSDDSVTENDGNNPTDNNVINLMPTQTTKVAFASSTTNLLTYSPITVGGVDNPKVIDKNKELAIVNGKLPEGGANLGKVTEDFMYYAENSDMELEFYPVAMVSGAKGLTIGYFYYDPTAHFMRSLFLKV